MGPIGGGVAIIDPSANHPGLGVCLTAILTATRADIDDIRRTLTDLSSLIQLLNGCWRTVADIKYRTHNPKVVVSNQPPLPKSTYEN